MKGRILVLLTALLLVVCTSAAKPPRIFSEDYIEGVYGRFFELTEEGNSAPCPKAIDHFKRGSPSAMGNSWIVPHNKIIQNGALCNDGGVLVLNPYNETSTMPPALMANKIAEKTFELMQDDSTGFWMGPDARTCGKWVFPNPSYIFFVREFESHIQSFFNLDLAPGKKYMFVVAPTFTCIYEDIPRKEPNHDVIGSTPNGSDGEEAGESSEAASTPGKPESEAGVNPGTSAPSSSGAPEDADNPNDTSGTTDGGSDAVGSTEEGEGSDDGPADEASTDGLSILDVANGAEPLPASIDPGTDDLSIADIAPDVPDSSGEGEEPETSDPDSTEDTSEEDPSDDSGDGGVNGGDGESISDINNENDGGKNETFGVESDSGESLCFPGSATVELLAGYIVRMDRLSIGDEVRVGVDAFSSVFMFTHKAEMTMTSFIQLATGCGKTIRLTAGHLLYVNGALKRAGDVEVGDILLAATGKQTKVVNISTVRARGVYNPQTMHGDIVVDGIVSSTYTTTVAPVVAHGVLAPLRAVWNTFRLKAMGSALESHSLSRELFSLVQSDMISQIKSVL